MTGQGEQRVRQYVEAALHREIETLRAVEGNRNDALNRAAHALGKLVGPGELPEEVARAELEAAAAHIGLPPGEARDTITSGLNAGMAQPRDLSHVGASGDGKAWALPRVPARPSTLDRARDKLAGYRPLIEQQRADLTRQWAPLKPEEDGPEVQELARRGLLPALESGALVAYRFTGRPYSGVRPSAVGFEVRGPDGQPWAFKWRNPGTQAELDAAGVERYRYAKGHKAAAWCSPGFTVQPAAPQLWTEGELNGVAALLALQACGIPFAVQGIPGTSGTPHLDGLTGKPVFVSGHPDAPEQALGWARLALEAGANVAYVLPPLPDGHKDVNDLLIAVGARTAGEVLQDLMKRATRAELPAPEEANQQAEPHEDGEPSEDRKRPPAGTRALEYALQDGAQLWHDGDGGAYITVRSEGHEEHYKLPSRGARDYLTGVFFERERRALSSQAQQEAFGVLQAMARREGQAHPTAARVKHFGGRTYLDLGTPSWEAVEVGAGYWKVVGPHECPVRFIRPRGLGALPVPEEGGTLAELRDFLNTDDRGFVLCVAWAVGALSGLGPFPLLALGGEQGTGKSTTATLLRNLFDPNAASRRRPPKNEQDLFVGAQSSHVLSYDNLSGVPAWLSDALCTLATGGTFTARAQYTDDEEALLQAMRPVIVNGIPELLSRPDLAERSLAVSLHRIAPAKRLTEREFWARYERARPRLLGALLSALAAGLKHLEEVELAETPRMADFARLIVAAEGALPWAKGAFLTAYAEVQQEAASAVLDGDPIAEALRAFVDQQGEWAGTVKALLAALDAQEGIPDARRPPQGWPRTPKALGTALRRLAPALRATGYEVTPLGRKNDGERYELRKGVQATFTKYTTFTKPRQDEEKAGERSGGRRAQRSPSTPEAEGPVNFEASMVNIPPCEVHGENRVQDGESELSERGERSAPSLSDEEERDQWAV